VLAASVVAALGGQAPPVPPATTPPALAAASASASTLPRLRSLLVSQRGELVLERYFKNTRATTPANIKSASKSVISALVGAALATGHLKDVTDPVAPYFAADLGPSPDPRKRGITIEHLLTMKSGLESTSGRNYGAWVSSGNWVRYALRQPLIADPGTAMEYSTGNSHLLSAVLTKATRRSTWQFAQEALAKPLGFTLPRWPQDPQGIFFGGNDMLMTPRQMVRFGELYLDDGRAGERQVLPEGWVKRSFVPRGRSRWGNDREYGYSWWIRTLGSETAYYAWGYGGQFIFVVPSLELVVVTTSDPDSRTREQGHLEAIHSLLDSEIVRAVGG
jgi:CubicO group peptidase (beta-lactamase class C family)